MDGPNLYAYVRNMPSRHIDPSGRQTGAAVLAGASRGARAGRRGAAAVAGAIIGGILGGLGLLGDPNAPTQIIDVDVKLPFVGPPGETLRNDGQTRRYGADGFPETDVDTGHDHNGMGDPHTHDWGRPDRGRPTDKDRGPARPRRPGDPEVPRSCLRPSGGKK